MVGRGRGQCGEGAGRGDMIQRPASKSFDQLRQNTEFSCRLHRWYSLRSAALRPSSPLPARTSSPRLSLAQSHRIILHLLQIIFYLRRLGCIAELSLRPQNACRKGATLDVAYRCQQLRQVAALLEAIRPPPLSDFSFSSTSKFNLTIRINNFIANSPLHCAFSCSSLTI